METLACIRVKMVSTGWMASVEIPPEIQPAVKSIQDDSLDMILYIVWLLFEAMMRLMKVHDLC
jgi:hypothetical protein